MVIGSGVLEDFGLTGTVEMGKVKVRRGEMVRVVYGSVL